MSSGYRAIMELAAFIVTAFGLAFALDYVLVLPVVSVEGFSSPVLIPLLVARMATPTLGALVAYVVAGRPGRLTGWLAVRTVSFHMILYGYLAAVAAYTISLPVSAALGVRIEPCGPLWESGLNPLLLAVALMAAGLAAGVTVNLVVALGEEAGWRGYLLRRLEGYLGFWPAALLVGVIWGLWHAPLVAAGYDYTVPLLSGCGPGANGVTAILAFIAYTAAAGLVAAELQRLAGSSLVPAAFHGTINAVAGFYATLTVGSRLLGPPAGLAVTLSMGIVALAIAIAWRGS